MLSQQYRCFPFISSMQQVTRMQRDKKTILIKDKCSPQTPLPYDCDCAIVLLFNAGD